MTKYLWGFPGLGKSSFQAKNLRCIDADSKRYQYRLPEGREVELHSREVPVHPVPDPNYPKNYIDHVLALDADVILLNCHINLLTNFPKENLLVIYPTESLKEEYLARYRQRCDHDSFVTYMEQSFEDMVAFIRHSPFRKIEVVEPHIYLQNLYDGGTLMSQFMSKPELTQLFEESIELGVYTPGAGNAGRTPADLAQMLFEGEIDLDVNQLSADLTKSKEIIRREHELSERRGGLSREELEDKIMQGIVNGALRIHHGEISPYSHGYEVTFSNAAGACDNRWECYCGLPKVAETIVKKIENESQDPKVFSAVGLKRVNIGAILSAIDEREECKITSYMAEHKTNLESRKRWSGHVATLDDIHNGRALDGIIQGHFRGDYSTITTNTQNETMRALVALKGFCLDCVDKLEHPYRAYVVDYLKKHGTDISTPEKLCKWIMENPDKCGLSANRKRKKSIDSKIQEANARKSSHQDLDRHPAKDPER